MAVRLRMALWELLAPCRPQLIRRTLPSPNNFALVVLNTFVLRLLWPFAAVDVAFRTHAKGCGLFNVVLLPGWLTVSASVALLDPAVYSQHAVFHAAPLVWRRHRMHRADLEFHVTTDLRFHPGDISISMLIKFATALMLGVAPVAVLTFEVVPNTTSIFDPAMFACRRGSGVRCVCSL